ncbi:MAG: haloacid dehalogenase-like hydrolase [Acidobacteria bacterium]|nr:haloacid dehalogenase-like hydrolase [Acidobacteriota bacterium]MBI3427213.1 haloacid dehalogenase-like hydrolase [Acidobacteriota bacterium]
MQLAIFDIDGTLTHSNEIDNRCFIQAFADEFGIVTNFAAWQDCPHITDSGLTHFILSRHFGREPLPAEFARIEQRFMRLLTEAVSGEPDALPPLPGASAALERLQREASWAVAIATGCWAASAQFKLRHAQINCVGIPTATADVHHAREAILSDALLQAESFYQTVFDRVVYLGDALWDVRTTRNLNWPFIGVGAARRAEVLRNAGASHIISDFTDYAALLDSLREAQVPQ